MEEQHGFCSSFTLMLGTGGKLGRQDYSHCTHKAGFTSGASQWRRLSEAHCQPAHNAINLTLIWDSSFTTEPADIRRERQELMIKHCILTAFSRTLWLYCVTKNNITGHAVQFLKQKISMKHVWLQISVMRNKNCLYACYDCFMWGKTSWTYSLAYIKSSLMVHW